MLNRIRYLEWKLQLLSFKKCENVHFDLFDRHPNWQMMQQPQSQ